MREKLLRTFYIAGGTVLVVGGVVYCAVGEQVHPAAYGANVILFGLYVFMDGIDWRGQF